MSDPGTGKTLSALKATEFRAVPTLIVCPKTLQYAAWGYEIDRFFPHLSYSVITADNGYRGWSENSKVYIINTDGVKWLATRPISELTRRFKDGNLLVDESAGFKNPSSKRSKALVRIAQLFRYKTCMSGTPMPQSILDMWNQVYILDQGKRLGRSYYAFRMATCTPKQVGMSRFAVQWTPNPNAHLAVAGLLRDITVRHILEECVDMPEMIRRTVPYKLPDKVAALYYELERHMTVQLANDEITAVNAAVLTGKLLQIASGAVYDREGVARNVYPDRYELVGDLIEEVQHCVVFFQWRHQRDEIIRVAAERGRKFRVIDEHMSLEQRTKAVLEFQAGEINDLYAHPKSAGHGLTLTKGTRCLWPSPTFDLELFEQGMRRIYRIGQKQRTETIIVEAQVPVERLASARLIGKRARQTNLLELLKGALL